MRLPLPFRREARDTSTLENPSVDLVTALVGEADGSLGIDGVSMTPAKAMRLTAVYACVRLIAETVGSLPLPVYKRAVRSRERVYEDPRWSLLNDSPNPEMTAMELHETTIANANLWGHGYQFVEYNRGGPDDGKAKGIWPLRPDRTKRMRSRSGQLYYSTQLDSGELIDLMADQVIDLKALYGESPIRTTRQALSAAMSAEEYGARFWGNNARPGGVIEVESGMDDEQYQEFRTRWLAGHQGLKRSQLVGILTNGASWKDVGIAPGLAQFIETRQFGQRQIAQMFRLPPHTIGDLEGTVSRASIEQQAIELVVYSLRPWFVRYEQQFRLRLFNTKDDKRGGVYPEFLVDGLMRGDIAARYEAFAKGIQFGWMSRADARELENMPFVEGLDTFLVPVNMMSSEALTAEKPIADETLSALSYLSLLVRSQPKAADALELLNSNGSTP